MPRICRLLNAYVTDLIILPSACEKFSNLHAAAFAVADRIMLSMFAMQQHGRVVLVTGASSGIGLALARTLWQSQFRVVITARKESLSKLARESLTSNERYLVKELDVSRDDERRACIKEIDKDWGGVDILINNAGISYRAVIEHTSEEDYLRQFAVNFLGPMELIRLVLPGMRKKRGGHIINVSSVGGMMAMPTMGAYSASKFALEGASEALWHELKPWNIKVTLVQPGFVHSSSFQKVYLSDMARLSTQGNDGYSLYYQNMQEFIERFMNRSFATPASIARKIMRVVESSNPPLRLPVTADATIFGLMRRFLPRRFYHWVLYRNLPGIKEWGR